MDFINHKERGMVFHQVLFLSPLQCTVTELQKYVRSCMIFEEILKRLREFEEIEISRQSCRGYCEQHGGKVLRLSSGFRPRIRPLKGFFVPYTLMHSRDQRCIVLQMMLTHEALYRRGQGNIACADVAFDQSLYS